MMLTRILSVTAVWLILPGSGVAADVKEFQSSFTTADKTAVTSSNLMKMINGFIGKTYQDLELIVTSCRAGEFGSRADGLSGLVGNWSVDTGSDTKSCTTWSSADGLRFGWPPSYISALTADKTAGAKALFDTAKANSKFPTDNPQYFSSMTDGADKASVHAGKSGNYALVFNTSNLEKGFRNQQSRKLYKALIDATYTDATIEYLAGETLPNPKGIVDRTANYKDLVDGMKALGTQMRSGTPADNKGYIFIQAHGGYDERTVSYLDGQLGQQGGGTVVSNQIPGIRLFADDTTVIGGLKEEVPNDGGGFWADDPEFFRTQQPYILLSTSAETFSGSTDVGVLLNGKAVGHLTMGNPLGFDYQIDIPDDVLNSIFPSMDATGFLNLQLQFANDADSIRLAVLEDYLSPDYTHFDYGVTLGYAIDTLDPVFAPESGAMSLFVLGLLLMLALRARQGQSFVAW